eukprot:scaffold87002_cov35-Prasinocladus_malaysianus.AAC.2
MMRSTSRVTSSRSCMSIDGLCKSCSLTRDEDALSGGNQVWTALLESSLYDDIANVCNNDTIIQSLVIRTITIDLRIKFLPVIGILLAGPAHDDVPSISPRLPSPTACRDSTFAKAACRDSTFAKISLIACCHVMQPGGLL